MALVTIDEVADHLNLGDDLDGLPELELQIDAVTAHVAEHYRPFTAATYTERLATSYDAHRVARLMPSHYPVTAVTSVTDWTGETSYLADFIVSASGNFITHDSLTAGEWDVTYTVAAVDVPADLKLAALEDIRGIYGPGQVGGGGAFGGLGQPDAGPGFRPVTLWPRVDAWIASRLGPAIG